MDHKKGGQLRRITGKQIIFPQVPKKCRGNPHLPNVCIVWYKVSPSLQVLLGPRRQPACHQLGHCHRRRTQEGPGPVTGGTGQGKQGNISSKAGGKIAHLHLGRLCPNPGFHRLQIIHTEGNPKSLLPHWTVSMGRKIKAPYTDPPFGQRSMQGLHHRALLAASKPVTNDHHTGLPFPIIMARNPIPPPAWQPYCFHRFRLLFLHSGTVLPFRQETAHHTSFGMGIDSMPKIWYDYQTKSLCFPIRCQGFSLIPHKIRMIFQKGCLLC